jgi:hypothetical protein
MLIRLHPVMPCAVGYGVRAKVHEYRLASTKASKTPTSEG